MEHGHSPRGQTDLKRKATFMIFLRPRSMIPRGLSTKAFHPGREGGMGIPRQYLLSIGLGPSSTPTT